MRLNWIRRDRWCLREASACDRYGWRSLTDKDAVLEWPLTGGSSAEATTRWLIERDGVMIGGLALAPVAIDPSAPLHPWEELGSTPPAPEAEPQTDGRLVTRLFAGPQPRRACPEQTHPEQTHLEQTHPEGTVNWAVGAPLKALLQQAGGRRLVARVPLHWLPEPAPSDDPASDTSRGIRWAPSPWLQQFTYRALDARALSVWTDAGFRLEGFYRSDPPLARLVWDNTRG